MATRRRPPVLSVQVDVDTVDRLCRFYGFEGSANGADDAVYRLALPRFAELFETLGITATFFVVGDDLGETPNREVVRRLHAAGHEIANHTQTHDYRFACLSRPRKRDEIVRAGQAIESVTGQTPVGFRAPGYAVDAEVLDLLRELGYGYDSSIMPSILNVPMKAFHALASGAWGDGYGSVALSAAPNRAYRPDGRVIWRTRPTGALWEIPVSCVPYLRLPFYANFNLFTGHTLFRLSAALAAGRDCNYVFHGVELLDPSEVDPRIHRHPNVRLPLVEKVSRCRRMLGALRTGRRVLVSADFAAELERAAADAAGARAASGAPANGRGEPVGRLDGRQVVAGRRGERTGGWRQA